MRRAAVTLAAAAAALLVAGVWAGAAHAAKETAATHLAAERSHWAEMEFDLVITDADAVLAAADATVPQRIEALWLKGSALVVLDRPDEAVVVFGEVLTLDSEFVAPDGTTTRILVVFEPARAAWQVARDEELATRHGAAFAALRSEVQLPAKARGGRPLDVIVRLTDPKGIAASIVLSYRKRGDRDYSTVTAKALPGDVAMTIPGAMLAADKTYDLELYVRIRHARGGTLRRHGDASRPLSLTVGAGNVPEPSVTKRWWFWAGAVAVVASAVALPYLYDQATDVGGQHVVAGGQ